MNVQGLKVALALDKSSAEHLSGSWLENQYPKNPSGRCSKVTYLNYQNLEDCFGVEARGKIEKYVAERPEVRVVIVAALGKRGKPRGPKVFLKNEADYYTQYELFAVAFHMHGFVEVFHNIERS